MIMLLSGMKVVQYNSHHKTLIKNFYKINAIGIETRYKPLCSKAVRALHCNLMTYFPNNFSATCYSGPLREIYILEQGFSLLYYTKMLKKHVNDSGS